MAPPLRDYAETLDPLPNPQWTFRRVYLWLVSTVLLIMLWRAVERAPPDAIETIALGLIVLLGFALSIYLIGPTAEHIVRLGAALKLPERRRDHDFGPPESAP